MTAETAVTVRVPAKVNLQLAVGPAREDGYHDLVNVFHAVSLFDEVTARHDDRVCAGGAADVTAGAGHPERDVADAVARLRVEPATDTIASAAARVPLDHTNLAHQAVELLAADTGVRAPVELTIRKAIPVAGGMAGGSADAAAALVACDALWGTGRSAADLARLAARLGSDVPFALLGGTAVGRGRGELLSPAPCAGTFHWVFAPARGGLSTADVYREYDRIRPDAPAPTLSRPLMAALAAGDAVALGRALSNDLQPPAIALRPSLAETLAAGRGAGALGALVSGSGPTCAFLAADTEHAERIAAAVAASGYCEHPVHAHGPVPGAHVLPTGTAPLADA